MPRYVDVDGNEYVRPPHVTPLWRTSCYAIVRRGGTVLMTRPRHEARWELPGGGVQPEVDGSLAEAATRECHEETGYRLVPNGATPWFGGEVFIRTRRGDRYINALTFYVEGMVVGEPDPAWLTDPVEAVEVAWLEPSSLTRKTAIWFHLDALRTAGICP